MVRKIIASLLVFAFILSTSAVGFSSEQKNTKNNTTKTADYISFVPPANAGTKLDNGLVVTFISPSVGIGLQTKPKNSPYYLQRYNFLGMGNSSIIECQGLTVSIINDSPGMRIVKWSESAISLGGYSGIPFLEGMKYTNAGNPSATPDTLIPPGQAVRKTLFVSRVSFSKQWYITGTPIPTDNSLTASIYIKVLDEKGDQKYYSLVSPRIGIQ